MPSSMRRQEASIQRLASGLRRLAGAGADGCIAAQQRRRPLGKLSIPWERNGSQLQQVVVDAADGFQGFWINICLVHARWGPYNRRQAV
jgi:hypothetical protein